MHLTRTDVTHWPLILLFVGWGMGQNAKGYNEEQAKMAGAVCAWL